MIEKKYQLDTLLNKNINCICGKEHSTTVKDIIIEEGAVKRLPELMKKYSYHNAFMVCDLNTYEAAGKAVEEAITSAGLDAAVYVFPTKDLVPDETSIGQLMITYDRTCDCVIGVGTGTINDICKYFSYKIQKEYFIVATAPSMDGFASIGSALIINNLKTTIETHAPLGILGPLDVLTAAPMEMINAGIGDILGKYTCLVDWKISNIINNEYYCPMLANMVSSSIHEVVQNVHLVKTREPKVIRNIMEALVLTGIAMGFSGNSRPASGCEHHISHYWEMQFLFREWKPVLHGTKVGIGTIAILYLYSKVKGIEIDFDRARKSISDFDYDIWAQTVQRTYGKAAEGVIKLEKKIHGNDPELRLQRINSIEAHWDEIVKIIDECIPDVKYIENILASLGAPTNPKQIGISYELFMDGIIVAKEVRDRYTLLKMMWDLGIEKELAASVAQYFYGNN